jgi:hypothetical protein
VRKKKEEEAGMNYKKVDITATAVGKKTVAATNNTEAVEDHNRTTPLPQRCLPLMESEEEMVAIGGT